MKNYLLRQLRAAVSPREREVEVNLVLQSLSVVAVNRAKGRVRSLAEVELRAFSQWGEDGIIDWLLERLPGIPETFVEFGVEDYLEANTRLLLLLRNWRGLVMDGSEAHIANIQAQEIYWRHDLTARCAFIDKDNINQLIASTGIKGEIGLLSVDIDGNDYWVWQAIDVIDPVLVVCEYNAVLGDVHRISVPYQADFQRTRAHHSNLYFGASLPAMIHLGERKGYRFVGTNSNGCNAFFVRQDHAAAIVGALDQIRSYPSRFREARDANGQLTYARGASRADAIRHLPVSDLATGHVRALAELGDLYSPGWLGAQ
ncbi:MAG: hypothetical protein HYY97_14635 [Rhodocyclales bacterium]|nr:hypothetical protein [Rhodocyclales bacterium]